MIDFVFKRIDFGINIKVGRMQSQANRYRAKGKFQTILASRPLILRKIMPPCTPSAPIGQFSMIA